MDRYEKLLKKWEYIINKIDCNNGEVDPLIKGEKATIEEVNQKESELGYKLPSSYKSIVLNFSKSLTFYYSFSDETQIPKEFSEIFSGEINWDITSLQNIDSLADELVEDGEEYGKNLRGKLEFSQAGNGDIYAFDMLSEGEEKPVIYWDHEEDTVTYIADSFIDYLEKISELNCVGSEKWQIEYFLNTRGLEVSSLKAQRWKQWFDSFSETTLDDVKNSMDKLIEFTIYRKKLDSVSLQSLLKFNIGELFDTLLKYLNKFEALEDKKMICVMIGEAIGTYAMNWVEDLWEQNNESQLDPGLRSYLSIKCLSPNKGLILVTDYLEKQSHGKINGYEALAHLSLNNSRQVKDWMERYVRFPVTSGWCQLYIESNPSWEDISRWSELEEMHQVTMIHVLEDLLKKKTCEPALQIDFTLPSKEAFVNLLNEIKIKQILRTRTQILDSLIENIDQFYSM
ncbi:hypothetical protein CN692_18860 [Bacillus sp. AFS002410]|uniref:SMI1/KNR4 family protein n=1 Tax=Bacillus sp. AFS002410 TaxID=2033481 RepID=UPI000BF1BAFC|nr:SMI1/KNR4 family protein [Bacillus sp. AFS002410]PEJ56150.1 hypothetical protein CN692_18860 [Bacillus sp. AFS002410]